MAFYSELIVITTFITASIIAVMGTKHFALYQNGLPGPGLWPVSLGILLIVLCIINFREHLKTKPESDKEIEKESLKRLILFALLLVGMSIFGTSIIGMLPSLAIFLFVSLIIWYKSSVRFSIVITLLLILVFGVALDWGANIQFPMGLFE